MKTQVILLSLIFVLFISCKKDNLQNMTVIRDCTGTYLQLNGKDYQVCNLEKTNSFATGAKVQASFKKLSTCKGSAMDAIVCLMLHENEGWIEVEKIK